MIGSVPAVRRIGGVDVLREPDLDEAELDHPAEPQVLLVCVGAFARARAWRPRERLARAGRGGDGRRPAVGAAGPGRAGRPRRGAPARGHGHRQRPARRVRLRAGGRPAGRRVRRPAARPRAAAGVPRARQPGGRAGRGGADGAGRRPPGDGVGGRAAGCPGRRAGGPPSAAVDTRGLDRFEPDGCAASGRRSRRADAGAGGRGRARAGRRHRPRAAPRGDGRRRRVRRRHRAREVDDHPLRRGGAGPRPAGHVRRPAVRGDRRARGRRRGC